MSDEGDSAQVNHLVPERVKEQAKENADHGELSEAVRDVYRMYASTGGAETLAQLEIRLRKTKRERESLEARIEALQDELGEVRTREAELQEQIREYEQETTEYQRLLAELDSHLHDGGSVFPDHGKVQTAAAVAGKSTEAVLSDLRDRNPEVPAERFREGATRDPTDELNVISDE